MAALARLGLLVAGFVAGCAAWISSKVQNIMDDYRNTPASPAAALFGAAAVGLAIFLILKAKKK